MVYEGSSNSLILAFEPPACREVAHQLNPESILFLRSRESYLRHLVERLDLDAYELILGIGTSAQLKTRYVIESEYINQFRGQVIDSGGPHSVVHNPLGFDRTNRTVGRSFCNLVSYLICRRLATEGLRTKYYFIHIQPQHIEVNQIARGLSSAFHAQLLQVG